MVGKFLFFLSAATATFLGLSAGAVTTSQNVDIIVTHGARLTTFTFVNNTGNTLPAGSPVSFGQAFRYGDIMPGTHPLIRDAATHVALPGQQCDDIANTGRDAPRHLRAGSVYDEYQVNGMFVYATSGKKDPLLYAQCNVDFFTKASDGVSPGDVRWVCHLHNSWENVTASSTGNAGNSGPAGF